MNELPLYRRFFAEEIRAVAGLHSEALVQAFATVPQEAFLGSGAGQIFRASYGVGEPAPSHSGIKARNMKSGQQSLAASLERLEEVLRATETDPSTGFSRTAYFLAMCVRRRGLSAKFCLMLIGLRLIFVEIIRRFEK